MNVKLADGARGPEDERRDAAPGKHWNGLTYQYEDRRSDFDGSGEVVSSHQGMAETISATQSETVLRAVSTTIRSRFQCR
jgi:hypothetical protein